MLLAIARRGAVSLALVAIMSVGVVGGAAADDVGPDQRYAPSDDYFAVKDELGEINNYATWIGETVRYRVTTKTADGKYKSSARGTARLRTQDEVDLVSCSTRVRGKKKNCSYRYQRRGGVPYLTERRRNKKTGRTRTCWVKPPSELDLSTDLIKHKRANTYYKILADIAGNRIPGEGIIYFIRSERTFASVRYSFDPASHAARRLVIREFKTGQAVGPENFKNGSFPPSTKLVSITTQTFIKWGVKFPKWRKTTPRC